MWSTAKRTMSISGTVHGLRAGQPPLPLPGLAVDVFGYTWDQFNQVQFTQLNSLPVITGAAGDFAFDSLEITVQVQTVIPGSPPYEPVELVQPDSLPCLAFRLSAAAGSEFVEVWDERVLVDAAWEAAHPERQHVALSGSAPFALEVPDYAAGAVPPDQFHFLRVGRAIRDEIGEIGESRAQYVDYQGKPGYMISTDARSVNVQPSFFPGQVDAPFGATLQIGGQFGANYLALLPDSLYYSASFWTYTGDPANPFDPAHLSGETQIQDPLFNKRYLLPTVANPSGTWETLSLGPFTGTVTAAALGVDPGLVGANIPVYKRPPLPDLLTEYWPFWDLMLIWSSNAATDGLVVLTLRPFQRTGGTDMNPELTALNVSLLGNGHLPLHIDNRPPLPKFLPYSAASTAKFYVGHAHFIGVGESVNNAAPMGECNELAVNAGFPADGNECILVRYSVEDGAGNPHKHVSSYAIGAEYTPKAVPGAPDSLALGLKPTFAGLDPISGNAFDPISGSYAPAVPPTMMVDGRRSVIVPANADGWPPEPNGDVAPGGPCPQYAVEVSLTCAVRTVDGWSRLYGWSHISRHLIVVG